MKIIFEMDMTNLIPSFMEEVAKKFGRSADKELEVVLFSREDDWKLMPRKGELVYAVIQRDPRPIDWVCWDPSGIPTVHLESFDEEELGDQAEALDLLLEQGWEAEIIEFDESEQTL